MNRTKVPTENAHSPFEYVAWSALNENVMAICVNREKTAGRLKNVV